MQLTGGVGWIEHCSKTWCDYDRGLEQHRLWLCCCAHFTATSAADRFHHGMNCVVEIKLKKLLSRSD